VVVVAAAVAAHNFYKNDVCIKRTRKAYIDRTIGVIITFRTRSFFLFFLSFSQWNGLVGSHKKHKAFFKLGLLYFVVVISILFS
jgi:hypothetical protein